VYRYGRVSKIPGFASLEPAAASNVRAVFDAKVGSDCVAAFEALEDGTNGGRAARMALADRIQANYNHIRTFGGKYKIKPA